MDKIHHYKKECMIKQCACSFKIWISRGLYYATSISTFIVQSI